MGYKVMRGPVRGPVVGLKWPTKANRWHVLLPYRIAVRYKDAIVILTSHPRAFVVFDKHGRWKWGDKPKRVHLIALREMLNNHFRALRAHGWTVSLRDKETYWRPKDV